MNRLARRPGDDSWDVVGAPSGVRVLVDHALTLLTGDGLTVRIEQPLRFTDAGGREHHLVPAADPARLGPVLTVSRTALERASAFDDGRLELAFADGSGIHVAPGGDFEAWQLIGDEGLRLVSLPGGGLSVWS